MKKILLGLLAIAAAGAAAAYWFGLISINLGAYGGTCQVDDEIAPAQRAAIESAAMAYARAILSDHPETAYALMTDSAQASMTADAFGAQIAAFSRASGPYGKLRLTHTYFLQSVGSGADTRAICGTLAGDQWVAVAIRPGTRQAHVALSAQTRNNGWAVTLWLLPQAGGWRVQYSHLGIASAAGRTPEMLLAMARRERDSGHAFNATMLYAGVQSTIDRGAAFQLGIEQTARGDFAKLRAPSELQGKPPFVWTMNGKRYRVAQVTILGIGKDLGLVFVLPQSDWPDNAAIDKRNHEFLDAFIASHSDYARDFNFLAARAMKSDNSGGFGTVYQNGKGYD